MKIDTHQHFWRYQSHEFPWIGPAEKALARDFLPSDLRPFFDKAGIDSCIAVQARCLMQETDFLLQLAADYSWVKGVIGWVDLLQPHALQTLQDRKETKQLKGFRHILQDEPDPKGFMDAAIVLENIKQLQENGFIYEILLRQNQLSAADGFCTKLDKHYLVIDHIGKPKIGQDTEDSFIIWHKDLKAIAAHEHVFCKLSGLVTEANLAHPPQQSVFYRYLDSCLELFGIDRLLFGSDWPVCTLAAPYHTVVGLIESWSHSFSESEKAKIWSENAKKCYTIL